MKPKIMSLVAAMALLLSCGTTTQTSTSSNAAYDVPENIRTSFTTQYPTAGNTTWTTYSVTAVPIDWNLVGWTTLGPNDYMVTFDMNNQRNYAWYDANGNWIGTTYAITDYTTLPTTINTLLNTQYKDYTIESVQREPWNDHMAYEIKLKKDDDKVKLLVDEKGTV